MAIRCKYCSNLTIESLVDLAETEFEGAWFPHKAYYRHHASFDDLEAAAIAGCDLCRLIIESFKGSIDGPDDTYVWPEAWEDAPRPDAITMYSKAKQLERSNVKISINVQNAHVGLPLDEVKLFDIILVQLGPVLKVTESDDESDGESSASVTSDSFEVFPELKLLLVADKGKTNQIGDFTIGRTELDEDLGSDSNLAVARSWFQECQISHPSCWPSDVPAMPTRVVDVGNSSHDQVRLIHTGEMRAAYTALSHCWGGKIEPVLETTTLARFQQSISYSSLAANFRDAITITRNLGIRYIWIDSLCIIQDSRSDWEQESKRMGFIYRDAATTICAASSKGSKEGILKRRPPMPSPNPVKLGVFSDPENEATVNVYRRDEVSDETLWGLSWGRGCGPLATRGWTLQEAALSPKALSYGAHGIYWQCPQGFHASNGLTSGINLFPVRPEMINTVLHSRTPLPLTGHRLTLLDDYYAIMAAYSWRNLTVPSDKLPAISAISAALCESLAEGTSKPTYLAGLWDIDILFGLLWEPEVGHAPHVPVYRAPSWSWASTDRAVVFRLPSEREAWGSAGWDMEIQHYTIQPKSRNYLFGEVEGAQLVVRGLTMPLRRSRQAVRRTVLDANRVGRCFYDEPLYEDGVEKPSMRIITQPSRDPGMIMTFEKTPEDSDEPGGELSIDEALYCKEEYKALIVRLEDDPELQMKKGEGILITRRPGSEEYERAGYLNSVDISYAWLGSWQRETVTLV